MVFTRGDFNSKIGIWNDFTTENKKNLNYLPQGYEVDTIRSVRNNQNTSVNEYTHDLFNVCPETRLRILNCRICGDLHGHLTYVDFHGCSRIILVLTSEASLTKFAIARVFQLMIWVFSNIWPILLKLGRNYNFIANKILKETIEL